MKVRVVVVGLTTIGTILFVVFHVINVDSTRRDRSSAPGVAGTVVPLSSPGQAELTAGCENYHACLNRTTGAGPSGKEGEVTDLGYEVFSELDSAHIATDEDCFHRCDDTTKEDDLVTGSRTGRTGVRQPLSIPDAVSAMTHRSLQMVAFPRRNIILHAGFNAEDDFAGFAYEDDIFRSTDQPSSAKAMWIRDFQLRMDFGGMNEELGDEYLDDEYLDDEYLDDEYIDDEYLHDEEISGGYVSSYFLTQPAHVTVEIRYRVALGVTFGEGGDFDVLCSIDGDLTGTDGKDYIEQFLGEGNFHSKQWKVVEVDAGTQLPGEHEIAFGGYLLREHNGSQKVILFLDDISVIASDASISVADPSTPGPTPPTPVSSSVALIEADFDGDRPGHHGFIFTKDLFVDGDDEYAYARNWDNRGKPDDEGNDTAGLYAILGGVGSTLGWNISAGFRRHFVTATEFQVIVQFDYRVYFAPAYDGGDESVVLCSIDDKAPSVVDRFDDNSSPGATGWRKAYIDMGVIPVGTHHIDLGGTKNRKDEWWEITTMSFDNVLVTGTQPNPVVLEKIMVADFTYGASGFGLVRDMFVNGDEAYTNGEWISDEGLPDETSDVATGALSLQLGGINDTKAFNMSAGWRYTFTTTADYRIVVEFDYRVLWPSKYEEGEKTTFLCGMDSNIEIEFDFYDKESRWGFGPWKNPGLVDLGLTKAGTHYIDIGGTNNQKDHELKRTILFVDNVSIFGTETSAYTLPSLAAPTGAPIDPTSAPTSVPTSSKPTPVPSGAPTTVPSDFPTTSSPSASPTRAPIEPTSLPTTAPTSSKPTIVPSGAPTKVPSEHPTTLSPTTAPTGVPIEPTPLPSSIPTSSKPTSAPTSGPTHLPSALPTTPEPTAAPIEPTPLPTSVPTSSNPTSIPSGTPTKVPSERPTTLSPTPAPTRAPIEPSSFPTSGPTSSNPTSAPTSGPTKAPSAAPTTVSPTLAPTRAPIEPTSPPTSVPTSSKPTKVPSEAPTRVPSNHPTTLPPSAAPTPLPTASPTSQPSESPTTLSPTSNPTRSPIIPTSLPTPPPTSATPTVLPTSPTPLMQAFFDTDADGFVYKDNPWGFKVRESFADNFANGNFTATEGQSGGGGLKLALGGISTSNVYFGMSGGFVKSFTMERAAFVTVGFSYRVDISDEYDVGEYSEVLCMVANKRLGTDGSIDRTDDSRGDIPWRTVAFGVGVLHSGSYDLVIGGHINQKTHIDEWTNIFFDNVVMTATDPPSISPTVTSAPSYPSPSPSIAPAWLAVPYTGTIKKRHEACFVMVNEKAYLVGGRGEKRLDIFDPSTRTWSNGMGPGFEVHHFQCVAVDDSIYIVSAWTGKYPREINLDVVLVYDTIADSWANKTALPESRRRGAAAAVAIGRDIYLLHGNRGGHGNHATTLTWVDKYNIDNDEWTLNLANAPNGRDHAGGALMADGRICVAGGRDGGVRSFFNAVVLRTDCYDPETDTWTVEADIPQGRGGASYGTTCEGELMVAGGEGFGIAFDDVNIFDGKNWRTIDSLNQARHGTGLAVSCTCNQIHIASGSGAQGGSPELRSVETLFPQGTDVVCSP